MKRSYEQKLNELRTISYYLRYFLLFFGIILMISSIYTIFIAYDSFLFFESRWFSYIVGILQSIFYGLLFIFMGFLQYALINVYYSNNMRHVIKKKEEQSENVPKKESE
jgi:hypothetical protein